MICFCHGRYGYHIKGFLEKLVTSLQAMNKDSNIKSKILEEINANQSNFIYGNWMLALKSWKPKGQKGKDNGKFDNDIPFKK